MKRIKDLFKNLRLEFYLDVYLFTIQTRVMSHAVERMNYDVCRLRFDVMRKTVAEFDLYKVDRFWR